MLFFTSDPFILYFACKLLSLTRNIFQKFARRLVFHLASLGRRNQELFVKFDLSQRPSLVRIAKLHLIPCSRRKVDGSHVLKRRVGGNALLSCSRLTIRRDEPDSYFDIYACQRTPFVAVSPTTFTYILLV